MVIDCPNQWEATIKIGNFTIADTRVNICDDVCDCADLCGVDTCRFYDLSRAATEKFMRANRREDTLEGMRAESAIRADLQAKVDVEKLRPIKNLR